jgi:hypothetical protein
MPREALNGLQSKFLDVHHGDEYKPTRPFAAGQQMLYSFDRN